MSQSQTTASAGGSHESDSEGVQTTVARSSIQEVLGVLEDADCRAMIDVLSGATLSAKEIANTCNLPLSTTYRKLALLTDAGLVEEQTCVHHSGDHSSEYTRMVEHVAISLDPHGEMRLHVSQGEDTGQANSSVSAIGE